MKKYKQRLVLGGGLSFAAALFQAIIGFSPSLSLYFGAPEALVMNTHLLIFVSLLIAGILALFGLYAISGSGHVQRFPWLKQMLAAISCIYILRGFLFVPELLVVMGVVHISTPVAPRFILFSLGILLAGLIYLAGTVGGWQMFPSKKKAVGQQAKPEL
ncbi:MAG: hypothetical protein PF503_14840 [Desulfobacula sp.]|jgi:hypothetical protein|nr:hypothetical protein [Desulfobacula sp.]